MNIVSWLENLGLGQYRDLFAQNAIDLETLEVLQEDDLEKMGITSLGHRKKLVQAIGRLSGEEESEADEAGVEIELRDYLAVIWEYRKYFIGAALAFTLFFGISRGLVFWASLSSFSNYSALISLSFPGYEKDEYPNGSPFKLEDIIASSVLRKVYQEKKLGEKGIPINGFIKAFKVSYVSLEQDFIKEAYNKRIELIDKKLDLVELESLRGALKEELDQSRRSQVLLQFEKDIDWPLTDVQVESLLESVPVAWKENAINEKGVFAADLKRYEVKSLFDYDAIFKDAEPLIGLEILKKNIEYFVGYLADVQQIPNIKNYKTKVDSLTGGGLSINDIAKTTDDLAIFTIPNLIFSYTQLGVYQDSVEVFLFYESQIFQLKKESELLKEKSDVINRVMQVYSESLASESGEGLGEEKRLLPSSTIAQFDGSFVDKIIELTGRGDDMAFKMGLMEELKEYSLRLTEVESEIENLVELKKKLKSTDEKKDNSYLKKIQAKTKSTVDLLAALLKGTQELEQNTGHLNFLDRSMYSSLGYSKRDDLMPAIASMANLKLYVVGLFVVMMLVAVAAFLAAYLKRSPMGQAKAG